MSNSENLSDGKCQDASDCASNQARLNLLDKISE